MDADYFAFSSRVPLPLAVILVPGGNINMRVTLRHLIVENLTSSSLDLLQLSFL